jgi:NADPH:quinone reductase-like Zn-dependent oxidoreductase
VALVGHVLLTPPVKAGALAEYVTLPAATVVRKPDGLDFVAAAALPLAGAAAAAVWAIDRQGGHVVLVNEGQRGAGSCAI